MKVIKARLSASREDPGDYTKYVFQNLDTGEYVLCTKFPNWDTPLINLGSVGYLKYKEIIAGKETWYDHVNNVFVPYKFDADQFIDFVLEPKKQDVWKMV